LAASLQKALEKNPNAGVVIMTQQGMHLQHLAEIADILIEKHIPIWIDKPLVISAEQVVKAVELFEKYPNLIEHIYSGSYTRFKALPLFITTGEYVTSDEDILKTIVKSDEKTRDFREYMDAEKNKETIGKLKKVNFALIEGRQD